MILSKFKTVCNAKDTKAFSRYEKQQKIKAWRKMLIGFVIVSISITSLLIPYKSSYSAERSSSKKAINQGYVFNGYRLNDKEQAIFRVLIAEDFYTYFLGKSNGSGSLTVFSDYWEKVIKDAVLIKADQLQAAYENNEAAVDKKYLGKVLLISGKIGSINRGEENNYFVNFVDDNNGSLKTIAYMNIGYDDYLANLSKGEKVGLLCQGDRMLNGSAVAISCMPVLKWIEKHETNILSFIHSPPSNKNNNQMIASIIVMASTIPESITCLNVDIYRFEECLFPFIKKMKEVDERAREQAINNAAYKLKINPAKIRKTLPFWYAESEDKSHSKKASEKRKKTAGNAGGVIY